MYDVAFDDDRDEAIARAQAAGVGKMLLPAVDRESDDAMFALSRRYPAYCRPMMGLHPTSVNGNPDYRADLDRVAEYLQEPPRGDSFLRCRRDRTRFLLEPRFPGTADAGVALPNRTGAGLRPAGRRAIRGMPGTRCADCWRISADGVCAG